MIRLRGVPLSDEEASELAAWLRANGDLGGVELAGRIERALIAGSGMLATDRAQALAVLAALDDWRSDSERLFELAQGLREFVAEEPPPRAA